MMTSTDFEKATKVAKIDDIRVWGEGTQMPAYMVTFLNELREQIQTSYDNKNKKTSAKKSKEYDGIIQTILGTMEPGVQYRASELANKSNLSSVNKAVPVLKEMVKRGLVTRIEEKGVPHYTLA